MPVQSEFNMAIATLYQIDQGRQMCNEGRYKGDFLLWLKGLHHLYGEFSTWMNAEDQEKFLTTHLERCTAYKQYSLEDNLKAFGLATQYLRRFGDKMKIWLREAEDTSKHGG